MEGVEEVKQLDAVKNNLPVISSIRQAHWTVKASSARGSPSTAASSSLPTTERIHLGSWSIPERWASPSL